ncbi:MCE family protein [Chelativorans sp. ZYF759]|uniref:MCE family protein n=1 Tax=Chelativorans sp. ZYF759 TaxID=2692213 RepID=UPI00145C7D19|nr:MlaD family protein [Chelativorans sp. ZYF759]NMG38420.1 MCE family protein [Chelativorans sp. ZYF759]
METRANYVIVGIFTLVAVLAAFGFVYWTASAGDRGDTAELRIRIPGSASGLSRGSAVLFNGVRVGDVRRVYIDVNDPDAAIVEARIDRRTPITASTQVDVGLANLTGQASIEMRGSRASEANLLDIAEEQGRTAEVTANPSAVADLLESAQSIFRRADVILDQFEGFVGDVRSPLTETVRNVEAFSQALENNADGIDTFLSSVSELSGTFTSVAGRLETTLAAGEELIRAVDPDRINAVVSNVEGFTRQLDEAGGGLAEIMANVDEAVQQVVRFSDGANQTLARVDTIVESVDPELVANVVRNFETASATVNEAAENVARLGELINDRSEDIDQIIGDSRQLAERLNRTSERVESVVARVDDIVGSDDVEGIVADTRETVQAYRALAERLMRSSDRVDEVLVSLDELLGSGEAEGVMSEASLTLQSYRELAERLTASTGRLDSVLERADDLLGSDQIEQVVTEANQAMQAIRQTAENLNARVGPITTGLERFSGQGLREAEALIRDSRRSINRIEEAISAFERNPQRIITGGEGGVRQYDGRQRR